MPALRVRINAPLDFADADALKSFTDKIEIGGIVHLGAQAGVRYSIENPDAYVRSNLVGHCNMLELGRHRQARPRPRNLRGRRSQTAPSSPA